MWVKVADTVQGRKYTVLKRRGKTKIMAVANLVVDTQDRLERRAALEKFLVEQGAAGDVGRS